MLRWCSPLTKGSIPKWTQGGSPVLQNAFFSLDMYLSLVSAWKDQRLYAGVLSPKTMLDPGNAYTEGCVWGEERVVGQVDVWVNELDGWINKLFRGWIVNLCVGE